MLFLTLILVYIYFQRKKDPVSEKSPDLGSGSGFSMSPSIEEVKSSSPDQQVQMGEALNIMNSKEKTNHWVWLR